MRTWFCFLSLLLAGCGKVSPAPEPLVLTLDNNDKEVHVIDKGDWVRVKLRAFPPHKWVYRGVCQGYSPVLLDVDTFSAIRVRGEVPGDPEYDVFHVLVSRTGRVAFYLLDGNGKYVRTFEFNTVVKRISR